MDKILISYASFGEGHKQAAYALKGYFKASCCDLLDFTHPLIKKIYSLSYLIVSQKLLSLWRCLFLAAKLKFCSFFIDRINLAIFSSFLLYLKRTKPQILVVTHFFSHRLLRFGACAKGLKVVCIITDLRVHPLWVNENINYYFVATEAAKNDLKNLGVNPEKIIAGFAPLREGFLKPLSKEELSREFGFSSRPAVTFISSLRGNFPFLKESIKDILKDFNVFVIYGKNEQLKQTLQQIQAPGLKIFASHDEVWKLFYLSSAIVTKPGGLTIFEGIYLKKPFIFTHYIPGQERQNLDLLIQEGIAKLALSPVQLLEALKYFKEKSGWLEQNYPIQIKDIRKPLAELAQRLVND